MRITLEFDTDRGRDEHRAKCAMRAEELYDAIAEIDDLLRTRYKHGENLSDEEAHTIEIVRERTSVIHDIELE